MTDYDWTSLKENGDDLTFLRTAIKKNRIGDIAYSVNMYNFDMNFFPDDSGTPLCLACQLGYLELAKELVEWGADIHVRPDDEDTPLIQAVMNGHKDVVKWLLENGVNPDCLCENLTHWGDWEWSGTAFIAALEKERLDLAMMLLDYGASPDVCGIHGASEIQRYFGFSDREILPVFFCIEKRWNPLLARMLALHDLKSQYFSADDRYFTPLSFAIKAGNHDAAEMLIAQGHDVNKEIHEWAAVDILIEESRSEFLPLLLNNGLDLLRKNYYDGNYIFADLLAAFPEHTKSVVNQLSRQLDDRLGLDMEKTEKD